jgi:hypothetical protein
LQHQENVLQKQQEIRSFLALIVTNTESKPGSHRFNASSERFLILLKSWKFHNIIPNKIVNNIVESIRKNILLLPIMAF